VPGQETWTAANDACRPAEESDVAGLPRLPWSSLGSGLDQQEKKGGDGRMAKKKAAKKKKK